MDIPGLPASHLSWGEPETHEIRFTLWSSSGIWQIFYQRHQDQYLLTTGNPTEPLAAFDSLDAAKELAGRLQYVLDASQ